MKGLSQRIINTLSPANQALYKSKVEEKKQEALAKTVSTGTPVKVAKNPVISAPVKGAQQGFWNAESKRLSEQTIKNSDPKFDISNFQKMKLFLSVIKPFASHGKEAAQPQAQAQAQEEPIYEELEQNPRSLPPLPTAAQAAAAMVDTYDHLPPPADYDHLSPADDTYTAMANVEPEDEYVAPHVEDHYTAMASVEPENEYIAAQAEDHYTPMANLAEDKQEALVSQQSPYATIAHQEPVKAEVSIDPGIAKAMAEPEPAVKSKVEEAVYATIDHSSKKSKTEKLSHPSQLLLSSADKVLEDEFNAGFVLFQDPVEGSIKKIYLNREGTVSVNDLRSYGGVIDIFAQPEVSPPLPARTSAALSEPLTSSLASERFSSSDIDGSYSAGGRAAAPYHVFNQAGPVVSGVAAKGVTQKASIHDISESFVKVFDQNVSRASGPIWTDGLIALRASIREFGDRQGQILAKHRVKDRVQLLANARDTYFEKKAQLELMHQSGVSNGDYAKALVNFYQAEGFFIGIQKSMINDFGITLRSSQALKDSKVIAPYFLSQEMVEYVHRFQELNRNEWTSELERNSLDKLGRQMGELAADDLQANLQGRSVADKEKVMQRLGETHLQQVQILMDLNDDLFDENRKPVKDVKKINELSSDIALIAAFKMCVASQIDRLGAELDQQAQ